MNPLVLALLAGCKAPIVETPESGFLDVTAAAGLDEEQWALPDDMGDVPCGQAELMSGGAAAADFDGDGLIDVFIARNALPDRLYRNLGSGEFEEIGAAAGVDFEGSSNGASWADVDGDGDLDLYLTVVGREPNRLYLQGSNGSFTEDAASRGVDLPPPSDRCGSSFTATFSDFDRDGDLDLHTSHWLLGDAAYTARLLINDGTGHFTDGTAAAGVEVADMHAFTSTFADVDGDGWEDLLITADFLTSRLFHNDQDGTFTDRTAEAAVGTDENGMGSALADFDGDGDLDWFVTSIYDTNTCPNQWDCSGNRLFSNDGSGVFSDQTDAWEVRDGGWGWGTAFFDYDNDGDLDLTMTNGFEIHWDDDHGGAMPADVSPFDGDPMRLWRNDGGAPFTEVASDEGLVDSRNGRALLTLDFDNDGDLDVLVTNNGGTPTLFRNHAHPDAAWLRVQVEGDENRFGIGAVVEVEVAGAAQRMDIRSGATFLGGMHPEAHFGFGEIDGNLDEVRVTFPGGGEPVVLTDVTPNQVLVVQEP